MIKEYRVNGRDDFRIDFRSQPEGTIKMFPLEYPVDPTGASLVSKHLLSSGEICVSSGNEPRTLDRAKAIAVLWMEGYSKFIRTGTFPNAGGRVTV